MGGQRAWRSWESARGRGGRWVGARRVVCVALVVLAVGAMPGRAEAALPDRVTYVPPVEGTIVDPFRAPTSPYGPGNRGIDYATAPLSAVRASAAGEVLFAGQVAGALHITIRHPDGLRSSYSFVAESLVRAGQRVAQGQLIARTGEFFHFGVRDPSGTYLDPASLFGGPVDVHLVPSGDDGVAPAIEAVVAEPRVLSAVVTDRLDPVARWLSARAARAISPADALRRLRAFAHYANELRPETHGTRLAEGLARWADRLHECTPPTDPPAPRRARRILVQVAGIGSTSDRAAVANVDARTLGYATDDVVRFSYRGGRVPAPAAGPAFAPIRANPYDERDSQIDLHEAGTRLEALLEDVARAAPGVPIDVVAHSQGGVVARLALTGGERRGALPATVETLVTLGAPHQGANAATAVDTMASDPGGALVLEQVQQGLGLPLDPTLPAGRQLSQVSSVIDELRRHPVPRRVRFTSIAARGDLVVPAGRTATGDEHAHETVVPLSGLRAHDDLPASAATTREIALAVEGRAPTCRSLADVTADLAMADLISWSEDQAAVAAGQFLPGGPP